MKVNIKIVEKLIETYLGKHVVDKVTGMKGVATSFSMDLFGCVQFLVVRTGISKSKTEDEMTSWWFDVTRLTVTSARRVMPLPDYDKHYLVSGEKGAATKPAQHKQP